MRRAHMDEIEVQSAENEGTVSFKPPIGRDKAHVCTHPGCKVALALRQPGGAFAALQVVARLSVRPDQRIDDDHALGCDDETCIRIECLVGRRGDSLMPAHVPNVCADLYRLHLDCQRCRRIGSDGGFRY